MTDEYNHGLFDALAIVRDEAKAIDALRQSPKLSQPVLEAGIAIVHRCERKIAALLKQTEE